MRRRGRRRCCGGEDGGREDVMGRKCTKKLGSGRAVYEGKGAKRKCIYAKY